MEQNLQNKTNILLEIGEYIDTNTKFNKSRIDFHTINVESNYSVLDFNSIDSMESEISKKQKTVLEQYHPYSKLQEQYKYGVERYLLQQQIIMESLIKVGGEGCVFQGSYKNQGVAVKLILGFQEESFSDYKELIKQHNNGLNFAKIFRYIFLQLTSKTNILIEILELCQCSLQDEINMKKKYQLEEIFKIMLDLFDCLVELQSLQIIHLDIKPANILKTFNDQYILSDFGISELEQNLNNKQTIKGFTLFYASPEQKNYEKNNLIDSRSDVYSMGILLNQLLIKSQKNEDNFSKQQIYEELLKEIKESFIQMEINKRINVNNIHIFFIKLLLQYGFTTFLQQYLEKVKKIWGFYQQNLDCYPNYKILFVYQKIEKLLEQKLNLNIVQVMEKKCQANFDKGKVYFRLHNYKKAIKQFKKIIQIDESIPKFNLLGRYNIGKCFLKLGRFDKAIKEFLIIKKNLEENKMCDEKDIIKLICGVLSNLGTCYLMKADYDLCYQYYQDSFSKRIQFYSVRNIRVASIYDKLGNYFRNIGKYQQAFDSYKYSFFIKKNFNTSLKDFTNTLHTMQCIGKIKFLMNDCYDSYQIMRQCLEFRDKFKFQNNLDHAQLLYDISEYFLFQEKNVQKSLEYLFASQDIMNAKLNNFSYIQIQGQRLIGYCLGLIGQLSQQVIIFKSNLDLSKKFYSDKHPKLVQLKEDIAFSSYCSGQYQQSLEYFIQIYNTQKEYQQMSIQFQQNVYFMARCYQKLWIHQKAILFFQKLITTNKNVAHENILLCLKECILRSQDKETISESQLIEYYSLIYQIHFEKSNNIDKSNLSSETFYKKCEYLGYLFYKKQNFIKSKKYFRIALKCTLLKCGKNHPDNVKYLYFISLNQKCLNNIQGQQHSLKLCIQLRMEQYSQQSQQFVYEDYLRNLDNTNQERHLTSLKFFLEDLQIREQIYSEKYSIQMQETFINIAVCFYSMGYYKQSLYFFKRIVYLINVLNNKICIRSFRNIRNSIYGIGSCYQKLQQYSKAIQFYFYFQQLSSQSFLENKKLIGILYLKIGICMMQLKQNCRGYLITSLNYFNEDEYYLATANSYIGVVLYQREKFDSAAQLFEKCLRIVLSQQCNQISSIQILLNFCKCGQQLSQYLKEELYSQVLQKLENMSVEDYFNIALCYLSLNKPTKAIQLILKKLDYDLSIFPENHAFIAESYYYLGQCYEIMQDYKQSLNYYIKAKEIQASIRFYKNTFLVDCYQALGRVYQIIGEYQKALNQYIKQILILQSMKQSYMLDLQSLDTYLQVGVCLLRLNQFELAIMFLGRSLVLKMIQQNQNSFNILTQLDYAKFFGLIAHSLKNLNKFDKAIEFYQLAITNTPLEDINSQLYFQENISFCYSQSNNLELAISNYEKCQTVVQDLINTKENNLLFNLDEIGSYFSDEEDITYQNQIQNKIILQSGQPIMYSKQLNSQIDYLEFCLIKDKPFQNSLLKFKEEKALYINNIGYCYYLMQNELAMKYFEDSYKIFSEIRPVNKQNLALVKYNLANCFFAKKKYEKCISLMQEIVNTAKTFDSNSILLFGSHNLIATAKYHQGMVEEALDVYLNNINIEDSLVNNCKQTLYSYHCNVGACYLTLGNHDKALEYFKKAKSYQ